MAKNDKMLFRLEPLPFESEHFGGSVLRLVIADSKVVAGRDIALLSHPALEEGARLISCRISASSGYASALEEAGYRRVERLLTYWRPVPSEAVASHGVIEPIEQEFPSIITIGEKNFTYDRFHADPYIENAIADAIKAAWVKNSLMGRADLSLIAKSDGVVSGFVLCVRREGNAEIDLIAVAPEARNRGIGRALVIGAVNRYAGKVEKIFVKTQETNLPSRSLYESCGFQLFKEEETFHFIPGAPQPPFEA